MDLFFPKEQCAKISSVINISLSTVASHTYKQYVLKPSRVFSGSCRYIQLFLPVLLILASQRIEVVIAEWFQNEKLKKWLSHDVTTKRGSTPTLVEWCILAWVAGELQSLPPPQKRPNWTAHSISSYRFDMERDQAAVGRGLAGVCQWHVECDRLRDKLALRGYHRSQTGGLLQGEIKIVKEEEERAWYQITQTQILLILLEKHICYRNYRTVCAICTVDNRKVHNEDSISWLGYLVRFHISYTCLCGTQSLRCMRALGGLGHTAGASTAVKT